MKKKKGFERTSKYSNYSKGNGSVADAIEKVYNVTVTPNKEIYLCNRCTVLVSTIKTKVGQVEESDSRLRKVKFSGSYISQKIPATPFAASGVKRLKSASPSKSSENVMTRELHTRDWRHVTIVNQSAATITPHRTRLRFSRDLAR